ncbi:AlbA family DNA-binding domain-containing protein [Marinobacterium arenosum]|uniref:AlbA family DNA-binding domain-containing protein n=1 Tax=Marinobacterium arenosum TaxID=2862496 RepID=UPI001C944A90|nr:ATP-binding protein [Marinobacterium arenosum]MBY4679110.1 ATP-binding protein [Marinobacterium arenosum]
MISDELLERLRYKGEGADLDFKQAQYRFIGANDHEKSELLKDILAIANAYRDGPGYILIGFKDQAPHPAEVVGILPSDHIDDAALQQFVNSKVQPKLEFRYEERLFDGKTVAVIAIPKQQRPFYLNKKFGKLKESAVYVRRGSSTDEASPVEVARMGRDDTEKGDPRIELSVQNERNRPLPNNFDLSFYRFDFDKLPDYESRIKVRISEGITTSMPSIGLVNRNYWRDAAKYCLYQHRLIQVRLSLVNRSDFPLSDAKLEVTCTKPEGKRVVMMPAANLPQEPDSSASALIQGASTMIDRLKEQIMVDDRGSVPVCHIRLGTLLPGEEGRVRDDLAILASGPGTYKLRVRILAGEINPPIEEEHMMTLSGQECEMDLEGLKKLMFSE